jgi:hypothetical protein
MMAGDRHRWPSWYDAEQAVKLLLGLAEGIMQLIEAIRGC